MKSSNMTGLVLFGLSFFLFSMADALAKLLTESLHPIQIVWTRQIGLVSAALVLIVLRGPQIFRTAYPLLQLARGSVAVISAVCFVTAVAYVPIADAVAVTFVAPFIVTVLGALVLGEHVSLRRWGAVGLGFVGAMIIIRPGADIFHPAIFLVVVAASAFALRQVLSRSLAGTDNTLTTLCYTALTSFALLTLPLPFVWQPVPSAQTWGVLLAMAGFAACGEVLVIRAFEVAEAVVIAPMHYTLIIWATLFGWLLFDQLPDGWTWAGTIVIVLTGLYLLYAERTPRG